MKTTRTEVYRRNAKVVQVGYCGLSHTFSMVAFEGRTGHTSGVFGWNADIYEFDGFAICTGYRPFGKYYLSQEFTRVWEKKACELYKKIYNKREDGTYYTSGQAKRMRLNFRYKFEAAVLKEVERQSKGKDKKSKAA